MDIIVSRDYLRAHPDYVFVFGDNTIRKGKKGAATLRDEPNTYGFITKKFPDNDSGSFYIPKEYKLIYEQEMKLLKAEISKNPKRLYLISKLGGGLANRFEIFEQVIAPSIKNDLKMYSNIMFLW